MRADGYGCRHKHCIPPPNWGGGVDDGYQRLIVKVTGYGPRGARKELELLVKRVIFDYDAEPLIYIQGSPNSTVSFNITGTPEVKFDSGDNIAFILTTDADQTAVQNKIELPDKITTAGKGDDYEVITLSERPKWLTSVTEARSLVSDLEEDAKIRSRWFNAFPTANAGTDTDPKFTFVSGDAELNNGAGLLVVTGKLIINKKFTFKGVILVLGEGGLEMISAPGDARIEGTVALAKFGLSEDFLAPSFSFKSSDKLEFKYNKDRVDDALKLVNMRVMAVREQ